MFYDPNQENLRCPKNTCLFLIFIYFFLFFYNDYFYYFFIFYRFFAICIYIIIYFNVNNAIKNKNFKNYSNGLCLSLFLSIFSTCIKIIYLIIISANYDLHFIIIIFIDWISTIVLKCYKEQVRNFCSNNNQNIIFNIPLIQTNLANNNNNNSVQTNMLNNQNLNVPSIQPYYPNVNPQSYVQISNFPSIQSYYPNVNPQPNVQNPNVPYTQNYYPNINPQPNVQSSNVYAQNYYPNVNPQPNVQNLNAPYDQNYYPDENEVNAQSNVQNSDVNLQAPTPNNQK